jgi:outer membrane protein assembly factor BamA
LKNQLSKIVLFIITIHITSCDSTKRVAENDYLLTKNTVFINGEKDKRETIDNLLYQEPNQKILGFPLRLQFYNLARPNIDSIINANLNKNPNRRERLENFLSKKQLDKYVESRTNFNNWIKKTGEAPVIIDEDKARNSVKRLKDYHINNGWFDVEASYDIQKNGNKSASIEYQVQTGQAFIIDSISTKIATPIIDTLYRKTVHKNTLIKPNEQYRTSNFELERNRISTELRNLGLYHFNQDYITMEMDTIGTNKKVNVVLQIQNRAIRTPDSVIRQPFKVYHINDVKIITDYAFENNGKPFQDSISYNGYKIYSYGKMRYRPKALSDAMFISPGEIFSDLARSRTYRYLNELRTFKYPNIEYKENPDNSLSTIVSLTPLKKFSLGFNTEVSQSNIQSIGFSLNPSLQIRNIFRGAETFQISAIGSIGSSKGASNVSSVDDPFFDIIEYGVDLKLTIPRFFTPFYTESIVPKYMSPSTRISLSTTSQTNIGLDKQTFNGILSYHWQPSAKVTNRLEAANIQYVRNLNINRYFDVYKNSFNSLNQIAKDVNYIDSNTNLSIPDDTDAFIAYALENPTPGGISANQLRTISNINERKNRLTENNLIISTSFSLTNDERTNLVDEDFSIFKFRIELAGNLLATASDLFGVQKNANNRYEIFNVAYSQFVKTEFDYIKHWDLGKRKVLALRSFFGIAVPYGNSNSIPFSKSFFAGGPNDNRAWTAYNLGPGSSQSLNEFNEANLKFSFSVEQRFNLFQNLNGAVFVDTGNIWNVSDNVTTEGATFKDFNSLKDIAIGSGFGLRYDFNFFVFRFDIGFKTYDPSYPINNRWFNDYNFGNAVYNIGINYPF